MEEDRSVKSPAVDTTTTLFRMHHSNSAEWKNLLCYIKGRDCGTTSPSSRCATNLLVLKGADESVILCVKLIPT